MNILNDEMQLSIFLGYKKIHSEESLGRRHAKHIVIDNNT